MAVTRRRKITSFAVLAVLGLAMIAMVVTGIGTDGMGGMGAVGGGTTGTTVAQVGDRRITETEVTDMVNSQFSAARQQQPDLTLAAFLEGGTFENILRGTIIGAAMMQFGEDQGLAVSQRMVDREIVNIPAFRNFAGQFDEAAFRQALQAQNLTEAQIREDIARTLMQRQLLLPIGLNAQVPQGVALQYASLLLERRQGTIGVVPSEAVAAGINPNDAQIASFYQANQARFTVPERRVIRYAVIGNEQVANAAQASEQEIQAYYRQNQATYAGAERRTLQQVVLPDQAAANAFAQRVRGGASFAEVAAGAGFSPEDFTFADQTPQSFTTETSADVARQAFAAQQGAVVGPIRSELGFHVVRVEAVTRTAARPLQAVRAEIVAAVSERKRADALGALVARVEDRLAEGASFEEVVRSENLTLQQTPPITASGQVPGGEGALNPELAPVLRSLFEIDAEDPEPVVETLQPNQRFALVTLERVVPAAAPPLAQIRDQVRTAFIRDTALGRARQIAQGIADKISRGMAPARAFAEAGVRLPASQSVNLRRLDIAQGGQVPPPLALLFSLPERGARILQAPNQAGWFVVVHERRTPGDVAREPRLVQTTRTQFSAQAGEEIAQQFARAIEQGAKIERNEAAIRAARQRLGGGAVAE